MADVILFNQYFTSSLARREAFFATLPINLLCISTFLKANGIPAPIYELGLSNPDGAFEDRGRMRWGLSDLEIKAILDRESPQVVGIGSVYSRHYLDVLSLARFIKTVRPSTRIVLGGNHATAFWDVLLRDPAIDVVVRGEGEITFLALCRAILAGNDTWTRVEGIGYRDAQGAVRSTPARPLIENLDDLPMIDYSLVDLERYVHSARQSPFHMRPPPIGIVTSRGCPGKCVYCTVKAVWGRTWRGRSAGRVVDDIESLMRGHGFREFAILDDSASLDKKRWNAICDEIIGRGLDIRWTTPNGIAHWTLDRPTLDKMKRAGCYRVTFGIESGNPETRKFLGKPFSLDQAEDMIRYANRIGMWTICTNIIGFPYEEADSIRDTIRFAKRCGTDFAAFYLLSPIVTSDVYEYYRKEGLLNFDAFFAGAVFNEEEYERMSDILNYGGAPTKYFTVQQLKGFQSRAYREFILYRALTFLYPPRLLRKIRSLEDLRYAFGLVRSGVKLAMRSFYKQGTEALLRG